MLYIYRAYLLSLQSNSNGVLGNNMEKEPQKQRPKLKNIYISVLQRIFALPSIQGKW